MKLVIVGPGRLGRTLAALLRDAGWEADLVGRNAPIPDAPAVLLAVPDAAIGEVAARIPPGPALLHTSGASGLDVFEGRAPVGSIHPLMTFPGPEVAIPDLRGVPAALDGDPEAIAVGRALCDALGMRPLHVPGDRRLYHCAAVMAGNFCTVLLAEASRALVAAGVPEEEAAGALLPLALQSLRNTAARGPEMALTGPAVRGDLDTVAGHLRALARADLDLTRAAYEALHAAAMAIAAKRLGDPAASES